MTKIICQFYMTYCLLTRINPEAIFRRQIAFSRVTPPVDPVLIDLREAFNKAGTSRQAIGRAHSRVSRPFRAA